MKQLALIIAFPFAALALLLLNAWEKWHFGPSQSIYSGLLWTNHHFYRLRCFLLK